MNAMLAGVAGLLIASLAWWGVVMTARERRVKLEPDPEELPVGVADVLAVLPSSGIVLDEEDRVVNNSPAAVAYGLVRRGELMHDDLRELAHQVRRDGQIRERELELARSAVSVDQAVMSARVAPLGARHILLLVEDHTQQHRVEAVRRDFVANVSHELKTPVGGIALLAEAVQDAKDDPEAVERFAQRMQVEALRLGTLVSEIVDLSRIQAQNSVAESELVDIESVLGEAVEHLRLAAQQKEISIVERCGDELYVYGQRDLLVTAVRNLVGNAIAYSDPETRVGIGAHRNEDTIVISVTDQGHGIPPAEQERIFERFYRVDAARSRATGGTGLGLSIVKHICANHGGDVAVWSEAGHGSTFTIRLPAAPSADDLPDPTGVPPR